VRAIATGSAKPTTAMTAMTAMTAPGTSSVSASAHGSPRETGGTPTSIAPTRAPV